MNPLQQTLAKATVKIAIGGQFKGTGFFITPDGYILTAFHVLGNPIPDAITIQLFTGEWLPAQFDAAKSLPQQDLAVLKVNVHPAVCVPLGVISSQQVTDAVLSVGYPLGDRADNPHLGFYDGSISRLRDDGKIETDAVRGQGQSGGLLYHHANQRVIGVAVEGYKPERMIAGLAQRLDSLLAQWAELPEITARVAQQWDKQMNWLQYRWWLIGAAGILLLLGMMWFAFQGGQSTTGDCSQIVNQAGEVKIDCSFGTSK
jgi:Trypsin-like peptidase domain